jgi:hypothetical protein
MQPNGAWGWDIGDGESRLDYLPTSKQSINDGDWHQISVSFNIAKNTARLYFDGKHVAIYSLSELKLSKENLTSNLIFLGNKQLNIRKERYGKFEIESKNDTRHLQNSPDKLTVMSWNKKTSGDFPVSLYNLETDISEKINVATEYPEIVEKLKQQLQDFDTSLEK